MQRDFPCIVRCTGDWPPHQKAVFFLVGAAVLLSFAGGFGFSRYLIDRSLNESTAVLSRSAHDYEAEQALVFRQFQQQYTKLARRIAAIPLRKEVAHVQR